MKNILILQAINLLIFASSLFGLHPNKTEIIKDFHKQGFLGEGKNIIVIDRGFHEITPNNSYD